MCWISETTKVKKKIKGGTDKIFMNNKILRLKNEVQIKIYGRL